MKNLKLKLLAITVATTTIATIVPSVGASASWKQNQGNWYYLNDSGEVKTGWINDNGTWYYLNNSGEMKTGWVSDNGTWYYLNDSGAMKTGWINDNGTWYFLDASGSMQTGIVKVDGKIYSLDATTGAMQIGDVVIDGKKYTFAQSGEVIGTDIAPSKTFNSNGNKITETNTEDNNNTSTTSNQGSTITTTTISRSRSSHHSSSNNSGGSNNNNENGNTGSNGENSGTENTDGNGSAGNTGGSDSGSVNEGVSTNYLEDYREQYHYSVAKAWANDPNGMVYFNGEWHLFYQYYPDDVVWGPMHWGHAVSTDLIHWNELDIALEPGDDDAMGEGTRYIYSGSAVVDENDSTGFFNGGSGLVAIYTQHIEGNKLTDEECDYLGVAHGTVTNTEEQCIAYSKDNGRTWTKYNDGEPVLKITDDPLKRPAEFRDPKVFYNEEAGRWFMVVAGGPLRFFSSDNLIDWQPEAMQPEITTECPDFYKLKVEGTDEEKWVLSEGGRYYRVGDFKEIDGIWTFVPDNDERLPMNFAKDSYAAQTYYGTGENGTPDGRRIMINWMNNWDYCQSIGKITNTFNGQFTLQNELKLVETDNGIRLTQQPIDEYELLRETPIIFGNVTILPDANIMSDLSGSQYEIVAEFEPDENTTEVGFKLRVGEDAGQETIVKYNTKTEEVTLDRSKSGKSSSNSGAFLQEYSSKMNKTADGKIQLHIFVDASSVEVYGNNGEVCGTAQIFPNRTSEGVEVYSVGGNANATIKYYPLKGIWNNDISGTKSVALSLSESNFTKEVGEQFSIYTTTLPTTAAQGVSWSISDPSVVKIISQDDTKTTFEVIGIGNADLTATSKDGKSNKTASLGVYNRNVTSDISDLSDFQSTSGNWFINNNTYTADARGIGDGFVTAEQMNDDFTAAYTYTADAKILTGDVAALVLYSQTRDASKGCIVANILKDGSYRVFNFPAGQNVASGKIPVDPNGIYHLKAEIKGKHIKYWINDILVCDADQEYYSTPGYFGLNACNAEVEFTNIRLDKVEIDKSTLELNETDFEKNIGEEFTIYANQDVNYEFESGQGVVEIIDGSNSTKTTFKVIGSGEAIITAKPTSGDATPVQITVTSYDYDPDNTEGLIEGLKNFVTSGSGKWYVANDAYTVKSTGDTFAMSSTEITATEGYNYTFETDATVLNSDDNCAPSLVLFSKNKETPTDGSLIFNIQTNNGYWKVFEFGGSLIGEGNITPDENGQYNLKVDIIGETVVYYINGEEVLSTSDYTRKSGYVGLMSWNANVEFRNTVFKTADSGEDTSETTTASEDTSETATVSEDTSETAIVSEDTSESIDTSDGTSV